MAPTVSLTSSPWVAIKWVYGQPGQTLYISPWSFHTGTATKLASQPHSTKPSRSTNKR